MWVKVLTNKDHAIIIIIYYFSPKRSCYNMARETRLVEGVPRGLSLYEPLADDIIQYSSQGEVFLI